MADFDTISKTHARAYPMDFINHCLDFDQDDVTFVQLILEETMNQPSIIEYWTEQARQQSALESTRKHIFEALALRLQPETAHIFKPVLDAIDDLQHLEQLHRAAILAENVEDFRRALETNEN